MSPLPTGATSITGLCATLAPVVANITGRVQKKLATYLATGETVEAALLVEPKHTYGIGAVATAVAPRTASRHLAEQAATRHQGSPGMAHGFPGQPCVVAKTSARILVSVSNGLSFSAPVLELPLGGLIIRDHTKKLLGHRLTLAFLDGSSVVVDAQWGQPFDAFK
jgi:hypothetical protein